MNGYHGPFLTCIARNEQHVKLAAAAQARLIRSARPDAGNRPGKDVWPHLPREDAHMPKPRFSS